jgi:hypothetical protein
VKKRWRAVNRGLLKVPLFSGKPDTLTIYKFEKESSLRPGDMDICIDNTSHYIKKRRLCAMVDCTVKCVTYCRKCDHAVCIDHFPL